MEPRRASVPVLAIEHIEGSSPPGFKLTRLADGKSAPVVTLLSPYDTPVEGRPNSHLMRELRWYLECFLDYPFHPETVHAEHVLDALRAWGAQAFNALFDRRDAGDWLSKSDLLQIRSDDPHVLSWPWEALFDPQAKSSLALHRRVERRLNALPDAPELGELPRDRVNILLVVARPYQDDVRYRSVARPLVELLEGRDLPAHVDVLRPPTFDQLRDHLRAHPGYYHVLHFDGHGAYGNGAGGYSPHQFRARQGCLVFEDKNGEPDPKSAGDLSTLLRDYAVPAVVLNACQSATLDEEAEDAFATVATALLQSGMRSVVAMAYSLYIRGAQVFLPSFYGRLFETGSVAEATRAGRQQMLADKNRISARGPYPLEDWLLPVLYQQAPLDFDFATEAKLETRESRLPTEVLDQRDDYGFVGRDGPILEMERALHRKAPCILVQGLGGVGKTTLARGFLRWLDETGGLDAALWFDFREIRTAEYVLNRTGELLYGENFGAKPDKPDLIAAALKKHRVLMVWDNFESAAQNLTGDDRAELGRWLDAIRGTRGKVIMTSRSREEWIGPSRRFELRLGGLDGEERWEYCETILRELGLKVNRSDPELSKLMDQLAGHPLAMRVVLPKLESMSASKVGEALRTNIAELGLSEQEEQGRLFATLRFVEQGLAEELRPLLTLVALHESYVDANYLEAMAQQVDPAWTRQRIDQLMTSLGGAGLVRDIGNAIYEMHPLLTSYLRSDNARSEACERAFVNAMAWIADELAPREHDEQRIPFLLHGSNFHCALQLAENLGMHQQFDALTQSLATYAQHSRDFVEASRLFRQLAEHAAVRADSRLQASAYYKLGAVAHEQRNFGTARDCYGRSLAISEQHRILDGVTRASHALGSIALEQRDFEAAAEWYRKSLAISEQLGDFGVAATTYHELGRIAQQQRQFDVARQWYLRALSIKEQHGDRDVTHTYNQLGRIAQQQEDFEAAREWFLKSVAISEKRGDFYVAAVAYHNLAVVAQAEGDFDTARQWYLKSLTIKEKQGNLHGAANTYHRALGTLMALLGRFEESVGFVARSAAAFHAANDESAAASASHLLFAVYQRAPAAEKETIRALWQNAGLGDLPEV